MDRVSDRSKGFGFVTFASEDETEKALTEMNGKVNSTPFFFLGFVLKSGGFFAMENPVNQTERLFKSLSWWDPFSPIFNIHGPVSIDKLYS